MKIFFRQSGDIFLKYGPPMRTLVKTDKRNRQKYFSLKLLGYFILPSTNTKLQGNGLILWYEKVINGSNTHLNFRPVVYTS